MNTKRIRKQLISWYHAHRRSLPWRETTDPYAIWVSEVMLQQTQVATMIPYYHRFLDRFPSVHDLARAELEQVLKRWEGLGYYSRARHLHRAARIVVSDHDGRVPSDPGVFRALPGVGDYIQAAVLSIAFNKVLPVIDGNVKRVLSRLLEMDTPVNQNGSHKQFLEPARQLISPQNPSAFNQAMMELGALICRPKNPDCSNCPLVDLCQANANRTTADYPKRIAVKKVPHRHLIYGVILKRGKMLVVKRPENGFLGGLWEFPSIATDNRKTVVREIEKEMVSATGLTVVVDRKLTRIRHAYTHFTLSATVYLCQHTGGRVRRGNTAAHRWVSLRSLMKLPTHKAIHKFLNQLEKVAT